MLTVVIISPLSFHQVDFSRKKIKNNFISKSFSINLINSHALRFLRKSFIIKFQYIMGSRPLIKNK